MFNPHCKHNSIMPKNCTYQIKNTLLLNKIERKNKQTNQKPVNHHLSLREVIIYLTVEGLPRCSWSLTLPR